MDERPVDGSGARFGERGSLVPLLAVVLPVVALVLVLIVGTAHRAATVGRVQWAADATALAVAAAGPFGDGPAAGQRVAAANGATIRSIRTVPPAGGEGSDAVAVTVVVEVEAGGVIATAAATLVWVDSPPQ
ncbi:MAG: hypothetical protein AAF547_20830 [Actinomycetota bacterium]